VLGLEHPDTADSLDNLADLLRDQGEVVAARLLYERARDRGCREEPPRKHRYGVQFPEHCWHPARVTINERIEQGRRRRRRLLARVSLAAWRLEQAEREQEWALASANAEGVSIRALASAVGLSPSRVHQLAGAAHVDALAEALGELRAVGWPAPGDPDPDEDVELDGRDTIADRIRDEVEWLRRCVDSLTQLETGGYPPVVNLRPAADWPDTANVGVNLTRVRAVIDRIAADLDELARARQVADLGASAVLPDRRGGAPAPAGRTGPGLPGLLRSQSDYRPRPPSKLERAWDAWQAERYRRGEIAQRPGYTDNPFRPR